LNKKFILIIAFFTITVPGFFIFSYWYLGIFGSFERSEVTGYHFIAHAAPHTGDYNKTGEQVVKLRRILLSYALPCEPVLIYYDNVAEKGKPYLRSAGGCISEDRIPPHVLKELAAVGSRAIAIRIDHGARFIIHAQTAVALRKIWPEIIRMADAGAGLKFPLVQRIYDDGRSEFVIGH
jgi:hypothetical protein